MNSKTNSKEKILESAAKLFQIKGYNATGLNEILKESGAPKGSLYYYFPNGKEELALEAIKLASETIVNRLKITLSKYKDPREAIEALMNNIVNDLKIDNKLKDMSISLIALETYSSSELLRNACCEAFNILGDMYTKKLIENGFSKCTAEDLGRFIQFTVEGAITVSVTENDPTALLTAGKQISVLLNSYLSSK
ncbi:MULTISPECIES: TetR/AcrR family transcriptional regulator [Clostridium]|uniref:TetR/AcrR family transcriptional regulator n=1 Tax=Clostridium TaxID=1485 RepID=UPI0008264B46|nr:MULTISPECIES: TetR/AcrR family transcriptional regulator [Clostridium]PJI08616.1 TetR/AcrR family transcriptional regulator [Clostridium sp. CT7]